MLAQSKTTRRLCTPLPTIVSSWGARLINGSGHTGSSTTTPTNPCGTRLGAALGRAELAPAPARVAAHSSTATAAPARRDGRSTRASLGTPPRTQEAADRFVGELRGARPAEARRPAEAGLDEPFASLRLARRRQHRAGKGLGIAGIDQQPRVA